MRNIDLIVAPQFGSNVDHGKKEHSNTDILQLMVPNLEIKAIWPSVLGIGTDFADTFEPYYFFLCD
jgi:hypothetical protein